MAIFTLSSNMAIRGSQLTDEILQATGINVLDRYSFHPPDEVHISGNDVAVAQTEIQAIVDAHVLDPLYFPADVERARQEQAEQDFSNLPAWTKWTADEMVDYIEANVTNLASAIVVLKAMARMHAATRNDRWPNLESS